LTFKGANDPKAYLAWEMKLYPIISSYEYEDEDTLIMTTLEFEGYTMNWWNQITLDIAKGRKLPINSWEQLKEGMR